MTRYIVIFTWADDLHAHAVCERIRRLASPGIAPLVVDIGTFPVASRIRLTCGAGTRSSLEVAQPLPGDYAPTVTAAHRENGVTRIALDDVHSIWWRRPRAPMADARVELPSTKRFVEHGTQAAIHAAVSTLGATRLCVNPPHLDERANRKGFQLAVAEGVGLRVPATMIASEPDAIQSFVEAEWRSGHEVIYKPVAITRDAQQSTQLFERSAMNDLEKCAYCPTIFQRRIHGTDVRVVTVGRYQFALEQVPSDLNCVDVRLDQESTYLPYALDGRESALIAAMQERLGLTFGAYDFRRDADNNLWFLEANPSGQWLWLEVDGRQRVSEAFARVLVEGRDTTSALVDEPLGKAELERLCPAKATELAYRRALHAHRTAGAAGALSAGSRSG